METSVSHPPGSLEEHKESCDNEHIWWEYVWHEATRKQDLERGGEHGGSGDAVGDPQTQGDVELRESLALQGMEIASLRQQLLSQQLNHRQEVRDLKLHIENARREVDKHAAAARTHRGDRETKIAEMAGTIKTLSGRGELHLQLATCRQELETERLAVFHLRNDLEAFRSLLTTEQQKVAAARQELLELQLRKDCDQVAATVQGIPGVSPTKLIELMGGRIIRLEGELSRVRMDLREAQQQVHSLQRERSTAAATTTSTARAVRFSPVHDVSVDDSSALNRQTLLRSSDPQEAFRLLIDGESTPQKVLDSLEMSILAQRLLSQQATIDDQNLRIASLEEELLKAEDARLEDRESFETNGRAELTSLQRRVVLLEEELEESRKELSNTQEQLQQAEHKAIDAACRDHCTLPGYGNVGRASATIEEVVGSALHRELEDPALDDEEENFAGSTFIGGLESDPRENIKDPEAAAASVAACRKLKAEVKNLREKLRERTSQLKILMETLESLQLAGGDGDRGANSDLLSGQSSSFLQVGKASSESIWGLQALVKRIVTLTTESASKLAESSLAERRAAQLEIQNQRLARELNQYKAVAKRDDDVNRDLHRKLVTVSEQLKQSELLRARQTQETKAERDALNRLLRETESQVQAQAIRNEELVQNLRVNEEHEFREWLESVILAGPGGGSDESISSDAWVGKISEPEVSKGEPVEDVRSLVSGLLSSWKESVLSTPGGGKVATGRSISKSEQRFLQRIADFVMGAHERCERARQEASLEERRRQQFELALKQCRNRLRTTVQHLHRYRRRANAAEKVLAEDHRSENARPGKLIGMLREALEAEKRKSSDLFNTLLSERKQVKLNSVLREQDHQLVDSLKSRIIELESRGSSSVRGREEAVASLEHRIRDVEENFTKWTQCELPRLVSGLPITEDALADVAFASGSETGPFSSRLFTSMGLDRTYALSQALCNAKAQQSVQDLRIQQLTERNSLLKEKLILVEGIIVKWQNDIQKSKIRSFDGFSRNASNGDRLEGEDSGLAYDTEIHRQHLSRIDELSKAKLEREEELIEVRLKLEHAQRRSDEMKRLVDVVVQDEQLLKQQASARLHQIRIELEEAHARELRELRETYENERVAYLGELEQVADAVREAGAEHPGGWQGLVQGSDTGKNAETFQRKKRSSERKLSSKELSPDGAISASSETTSSNQTPETRPRRPKKRVDKRDDSSSYLSSSSSSEEEDGGGEDRAGRGQVRESRKDRKDTNRTEKKATVNENDQAEVVELQRLLALEREKEKAARHEVEELEQLLGVQRRSLEEHFNRQAAEEIGASREGVEVKTPDKLNQSHDSLNISPLSVSPDVDPRMRPSTQLQMDDEVLPGPTATNLLDELSQLLMRIRQPTSNAEALLTSSLNLLRRIRVIVVESERTLAENLRYQRRMASWSDNRRDDPGAAAFESINLDAANALQRLAHRVKTMEEELGGTAATGDARVPDRHLYLLRELRVRVEEAEQGLKRELEQQKERWESERASYRRQLEESNEMVEQVRSGQQNLIENLRNRYETALKHAEEALETQTTAAREQIERLEELLRRSNENQVQLNTQRSDLLSLADVAQANANYIMRQGRGSAYLVEPSVEELLRVRNETDVAKAELVRMHDELRRNNSVHESEMHSLKEHFSRFKRAQDAIIGSLESQLDELRSNLGNASHLNQSSESLSSFERFGDNWRLHNESLVLAEEQLREMSFKYKVKAAEFEAVMRTLESINDNDITVSSDDSYSKSENSGGVEEFNDHLPAPRVNPPRPPNHTEDSRQSAKGGVGVTDANAVARNVRTEIFEARIAAAEREIDALHEALTQERRVNLNLETLLAQRDKSSSIRQESSGKDVDIQFTRKEGQSAEVGDKENRRLNQVETTRLQSLEPTTDEPATATLPRSTPVEVNAILASSESFLKEAMIEINAPEGQVTRERVKVLVRRINDLRRQARNEVSKLRDVIITQKNDLTGSLEISKLKSVIGDLKNQAQNLREDNARKSKLLSTMKSAKATESAALEQWRTESKEMEESTKRLQRALAAKDALIKDLRQKIESLEMTQQGVETAGADGTDLTSMTPSELRNRVRTVELERARLRTRLVALKEKVTEQEADLKAVREVNEKLISSNEKLESVKAALARSETSIKALRVELEKARGRCEELREQSDQSKSEYERKLKHLQRQVEGLERTVADSNREMELLRQRLAKSITETKLAASTSATTDLSRPASTSAAIPSVPVRSRPATRTRLPASGSSREVASTSPPPPPPPRSSPPPSSLQNPSTAPSDGRTNQSLNDIAAEEESMSSMEDLNEIMSALGVTEGPLLRPYEAQLPGPSVNAAGPSTVLPSSIRWGADSRVSFDSSAPVSGARRDQGGTRESQLLTWPAGPSSMFSSSLNESSSSSSAESGASVEKRLHSLVSAALASPVRFKYPNSNSQ